MSTSLILLIVIGLIAVGGYVLYAGIIKARNTVEESYAGIDIQLRKRHDLIPNILKIAKKYMEHEKSLLTEVTELRAKATEKESLARNQATADGTTAAITEKFALEGALQSKMGQLMIAVENYPDLKADAQMLQSQQTYNEVEEHIAAARRFYNSAVKELRNKVQIFPGNLLAGIAGVTELPPFFEETDEAVRAPVDADAFLN